MEGLGAGFSPACWLARLSWRRKEHLCDKPVALPHHCSRHCSCTGGLWDIFGTVEHIPTLANCSPQLVTWVQVSVLLSFQVWVLYRDVVSCVLILIHVHRWNIFFPSAAGGLTRKAKWHVCAVVLVCSFSTLFLWDRGSPWAWSSLVFTLAGVQQGSAILLPPQHW